MRKALSLCFCLLLLFGLGATAYAAEPTVTVEPTGGDTSSTGTGDSQPIEVRMEMVGEVPYITKTYAVGHGGDAVDQVVELAGAAPFEQDGYLFTRHDTTTLTGAGVIESRTETLTRGMEVPEHSIRAVLERAERGIEFDQDGFTGLLALDETSIQLTEGETETVSTRVSDMRVYSGLDRQDAAYIPKSVSKNGVTLQLENVEWTVMGTAPTGDGPVANLWKATAVYSGTATTSQPGSYTATFKYTGTVVKTEPGATLVSIVYRGEPLAPVQPDSGPPLPLVLACVLVGAAILAAGVAAFVTRGRWYKGRAEDAYDTRRVHVAAIRQAAEAGYNWDEGDEDEPEAYDAEQEDVYGEADLEEDSGAVDSDGYYDIDTEEYSEDEDD